MDIVEVLQFLELPASLLAFGSGLFLLITSRASANAREERVHRREISQKKASQQALRAHLITGGLILIGASLAYLKFTRQS